MFGPLGQAGVDGMRYLWEYCLEERFGVGRLGRDKDGSLSGGGKRRLSVAARRKEVGGGMRRSDTEGRRGLGCVWGCEDIVRCRKDDSEGGFAVREGTKLV